MVQHRYVVRVIQIHAAAPAKPAPAQPCNGCGVCCASDPCPIGMLVSRRLHGACSALVWREDQSLYRCGLLDTPSTAGSPVRRWAAGLLRRLTRRYIAAGAGCDCTLVVERTAPGIG